MTDRHIADYLRSATSMGVIEGWYHTGPLTDDDWVVNTQLTGAQQMSRADIVDYVCMLKESGVQPLSIRRPE